MLGELVRGTLSGRLMVRPHPATGVAMGRVGLNPAERRGGTATTRACVLPRVLQATLGCMGCARNG